MNSACFGRTMILATKSFPRQDNALNLKEETRNYSVFVINYEFVVTE